MIYLYGAYGTGNLGDDAILCGALAEYGTGCTAICFGEPYLNQNVKWIDNTNFLERSTVYLKAGDILIFAGGGLFWSESHIHEMLNLAKSAIEIGARVQIARIGVHGLHKDPEAVAELFNLSEKSSVRDRNSLSLLDRFGVDTSCVSCVDDFALLIRERPDPALQHSLPLIGLNYGVKLLLNHSQHREHVLKIFKGVADELDGKAKLVYIPHNRHFRCIDENDIINAEFFWNATGGKIITLPFPSTISELLGYYASVTCTISWRYHMLVLSKLMDKPSLAINIPDEHKYNAFASENGIQQLDIRLDKQLLTKHITDFVLSHLAFS